MTHIMGDATGAQAGSIPRSVQMVAGYVTGLGGVPWSPAAWDMFPGIPHVTIDQGAGASPNYAADVIDIETGAWNVSNVHGWLMQATASDPAIYVNRSNINAAIAAAVGAIGWKGAIWLAFPGWTPGTPLPIIPKGCRYVAIQDVFAGSYDLSTVLDDTWPGTVPAPPATNWTEEMVKTLPLVMIGQTGAYVRRVQGLCLANGASLGVYGMDGQFGPVTKTAVETLQRAAGFAPNEIDGIVGQQTWPMLLGV